jgi:hypothetical protein
MSPPMRRPVSLLLALVLTCAVLPVGTIGRADAREGSPAAGPPTGSLQIVASGLTNPRGMAWGPDGSSYVALAGIGGTTPGVPEMPPPVGPFMGGPTARIVRIEDGCPVTVADGLPSTRDAEGGVVGVADLAILGGRLYALIAVGGDLSGNPGTTNGVYSLSADGSTTLVADIAAWLAVNPPVVVPEVPEGFPKDFPYPGYPFAMVADEAIGVLWVVDSDRGLVLTISPDGTIALVAELFAEHPIPTGIALAPQGGVLVGNLTSAPYLDGGAKVVHVARGGTVTEIWTGLTAVTGVAVGPDGDLYALEMSTGNTAEPPFLRPYTGRVVRQTGKNRLEEVMTGLLFPVALDIGPDGALYVAQPAFGAHDGTGVIVRFEAGARLAAPLADVPAGPECPHPVAAERPQ